MPHSRWKLPVAVLAGGCGQGLRVRRTTFGRGVAHRRCVLSGADGPALAPEWRAGTCRTLRDQLVETINVIRSQAVVVPSTPGLETVGERPLQVPRR